MNQLKTIADEMMPVYETSTGEKVVNGRELHEQLFVARDFPTWIQDRIRKYGFVEGQDFWILKTPSEGGRPRKDYLLTLDVSIILSTQSKDESSELLAKELIEINEQQVLIQRIPRKEVEFGRTLKSVFDGILDIQTQFRVLGYRIDFYSKKYNLAIEYDENHHRYQSDSDKLREKIIKREIPGITFVRVNEQHEYKGLNEILKMIRRIETKTEHENLLTSREMV